MKYQGLAFIVSSIKKVMKFVMSGTIKLLYYV